MKQHITRETPCGFSMISVEFMRRGGVTPPGKVLFFTGRETRPLHGFLVLLYNRVRAEPVRNSPQANITFAKAKISHCKAIYHTASAVYHQNRVGATLCGRPKKPLTILCFYNIIGYRDTATIIFRQNKYNYVNRRSKNYSFFNMKSVDNLVTICYYKVTIVALAIKFERNGS